VKCGKPQGAYYLGGLAVECALKACIAKKTRRHEFPDARYARDVHTHILQDLLKLADLHRALEGELRKRPQLGINRGIVESWRVESRYEISRLNGRGMVDAVNSPDGVLQWIKHFW